jgi:hypothetical protein
LILDRDWQQGTPGIRITTTAPLRAPPRRSRILPGPVRHTIPQAQRQPHRTPPPRGAAAHPEMESWGTEYQGCAVPYTIDVFLNGIYHIPWYIPWYIPCQCQCQLQRGGGLGKRGESFILEQRRAGSPIVGLSFPIVFNEGGSRQRCAARMGRLASQNRRLWLSMNPAIGVVFEHHSVMFCSDEARPGLTRFLHRLCIETRVCQLGAMVCGSSSQQQKSRVCPSTTA